MTEQEEKRQAKTGCQLVFAILVGGIILSILSILFNPPGGWTAILITICLLAAYAYWNSENALAEKSMLAEAKSQSRGAEYYASRGAKDYDAREAGYYDAKSDSSRKHKYAWLFAAAAFSVLWIRMLITGRSFLQAVLYFLELKETE